MEQIIGAICRQFGRRRIESQHGSSLLVIKTVIGQGGRFTTESTMDHAAVGPVEATYFEQVREVAVETDGYGQVDRCIAMIANRQPLIGRVAP